jgi:Dyp-type peroxidase family
MAASAEPRRAALQEGVYLERSTPPPPAWRVLFLDFAAGATPVRAQAAIAAVTALLTSLQRGVMPDLAARRNGADSVSIPANTFSFLLGYGASFFDHERHDPPLTAAQRPRHLVALRRTGPAFPQIAWNSEGAVGHRGGADLLLQFTGVSEHAVDRAAVEVSKLIDDQQLPLITSGTYDGFQRDDGRSWIGFHDGVSNIEPSERQAAVTCPGDPDWNRGGTYLAFLRIQVDLKAWRTLSVSAQEAIVGRDKLTGCPLEAVADADGELQPQPIAGCPLSADPDWRVRDAFFNPPETGDRLVEASHIHRVNQNRAAGTTAAGHRIFRQGYEYLEDVTKDGPRLGLNFVSFQNDLQHLQQVLGLDGWLGDVNFGGPADPSAGEPQPVKLMSLRAGGFYAVPPQANAFPGAVLFET